MLEAFDRWRVHTDGHGTRAMAPGLEPSAMTCRLRPHPAARRQPPTHLTVGREQPAWCAMPIRWLADRDFMLVLHGGIPDARQPTRQSHMTFRKACTAAAL